MDSNSLIARVRAFAASKNWKPAKFAKAAGLHTNTLRNFDSDDWNPTLDTLRKLEAVIERDGANAPSNDTTPEGAAA